MVIEDLTRAPAVSAPPADPAATTGATTEIDRELDRIVGNSVRKSRLRRVLHGAGNAVARWLEHVASRTTPIDGSDVPPQIRFPFF